MKIKIERLFWIIYLGPILSHEPYQSTECFQAGAKMGGQRDSSVKTQSTMILIKMNGTINQEMHEISRRSERLLDNS